LHELILKRDKFKCRACGVGRRLVVHHRNERNAKSSLITLCIRCHVRLHRARRWVPQALLGLWREVNPDAPRQLQLPFICEWHRLMFRRKGDGGSLNATKASAWRKACRTIVPMFEGLRRSGRPTWPC
jgi:hypothetical protein